MIVADTELGAEIEVKDANAVKNKYTDIINSYEKNLNQLKEELKAYV
jgi:hypothetical protein